MLTHVNFPTFAMSDLRYGGLIRCSTRLHGCISADVCPAYAATSLVRCTNRPFGHQRGIYETSHNLSLTHARRHIWRWRRTQLRPLSAGDRTSRMRDQQDAATDADPPTTVRVHHVRVQFGPTTTTTLCRGNAFELTVHHVSIPPDE